MLGAKDGTLGDGFGTALAAEGNLLAVGAPGAAGGGAVYVFERGSDGRWIERARLTAGTGPRATGSAPRWRSGAGCCSWARRAATASGERSSSSPGARAPASGRCAGLIQGSRHRGGRLVRRRGGLRRPARAGRSAGAPGALDSTRWRAGQAFVLRRGRREAGPRRRRLAPPAEDGHGSLGVAVLLDGSEALVGAPRVDSLAGGVIRYRQDGADLDTGRQHRSRLHHPAGRLRLLAGPRRQRPPGRSSDVRPERGGRPRVPPGAQSSEWRQMQLLVTPPAGFSTRLGATIAASERARGRRRAPGRLLRGHRPPLSARRRGRSVAGVGDRERYRLRRAARRGRRRGEMPGRQGQGFECKDADLVAFMPNSTHRREAGHPAQRHLGLDRFDHRPRVRARGPDRRHLVRRGDRSREPEVPRRPAAAPGRPAQHLARDQGLPDPRVHRGRRRGAARDADLRSHPAPQRDARRRPSRRPRTTPGSTARTTS